MAEHAASAPLECQLGLVPATTPVANPATGAVYDLLNIVPWLRRHGTDPVSGTPCAPQDLLRLHVARADDAAQTPICPLTHEPFLSSSTIVALRTNGRVYSLSGLRAVAIAPAAATGAPPADPTDGSPFDPESDLLVLQDPKRPAGRPEPSAQPTAETRAESAPAPARPASAASSTSTSTSTSHTNVGYMAASLTSSAMAPVTVGQRVEEKTPQVAKTRGKCYVRLVTSLGDLNLEIRSDSVPLAAYNFVTHCTNGFYDGTKFHRLIPRFMIQGGDPSSTGSGGASVYGQPFADEFRGKLTHDARGVVAMANKGPNTNTSQFFITFNSAHHLDNKHTVFGRVVGGGPVLDMMEAMPTVPDSDTPLQDIVIRSTPVFVNAFADEAAAKVKATAPASADAAARPAPVDPLAIGRYLATPPSSDDPAKVKTKAKGKAKGKAKAKVKVKDKDKAKGKNKRRREDEPPSPAAPADPALLARLAKRLKPSSHLSDFSAW
ncbi:peptidyl-prolyl cis-trans isomerase 4 [Thecamonas trahens ATCC 50062]|uniref:Peptidyl-prolyl cis-trans isomerase 4 n=1 Tax=Thecamonas trahens ATCC 50062 TaxID=461836 RepID=A0A0L0DPV3_THETB|nr:peptidyl-prolyl cis-trans isomerase 4 [Thecamonas trahens ATCC 50062]KNC54051.1 peptidyl-prolyl cis-trans isomerase 4 [Thecamonas trahens ATCC 50062]|eukprot:XP_013754062.1 peptidyl-prolyl cis-trans isomerase 4 [Thecamonas trahens ATCC 50062]